MKHIFLYIGILLCIGCQSDEERLEEALQKSVAWMWSQQAEDGGWHSQTHAILQDGKALTPFILFHLLMIPEDKCMRPLGAKERGIAFIRREIKASITMKDDSLPSINYPNYSAAYALRVLNLMHEDTALQKIIASHLVSEQFAEHRGFTKDSLAYGGWGYGEPDLPTGTHGHVDISHTRRIAEALIHYKQSFVDENEGTDSLLTKVQIFLQGTQRVQNDSRLYEGCLDRKKIPYDGGFISSTVTIGTNKSEATFMEGAGYHYPSYATATCDGFMALHALGLQDTHVYSDAKNWLSQHQNMHTIEGLSENDPEQWYQIMHYYHLAVRAEAMTTAGVTGTWSKDIKAILLAEQKPEGYYVNPIGGINKEDDPLMATIFAIMAMNKSGATD